MVAISAESISWIVLMMFFLVVGFLGFADSLPPEMGRRPSLLICVPQLGAGGAALRRSGSDASGAACGAVGVVKLVGRVGGVPVGWGGHVTCSRETLWAMPISKSRNAGGVALRMRVLSLPPTMAITPIRRAFS